MRGADAAPAPSAEGLVELELGPDGSLDRARVRALRGAVERLLADPDWRVLALRGEGATFSSGLDLADLFAAGRPAREELEGFVALLAALADSARPVVAVVEGAVLGGGLGLVAAAHTVIAAPTATFAAPELLVGMLPAMIGPFLVARLGGAAARRLLLGGRTFSAPEAAGIGLVDEVAADVPAALRRAVRRLTRLHAGGLGVARRYLYEVEQALEAQGAEAARRLAVDTLDVWLDREGVAAAIEGYAMGGSPGWWPRG